MCLDSGERSCEALLVKENEVGYIGFFFKSSFHFWMRFKPFGCPHLVANITSYRQTVEILHCYCYRYFTGDKNSTCSLIKSEIKKGQVILPKARILQDELLKKVILHITPLCSLLHMLLKDVCICLQDEWKL